MTTKQIRLRRGTTTEHQNFTGAPGEITFDTTKNTLRVHDGNLEAGHLIATESFVNGVFDDTVSLINSMAQGPKGDQGDTGPAGPAGPQGPVPYQQGNPFIFSTHTELIKYEQNSGSIWPGSKSLAFAFHNCAISINGRSRFINCKYRNPKR